MAFNPGLVSVGQKITATLINGILSVLLPATSVTPTLSGVTLGTGGTAVQRYTVVGNMVFGITVITLGTSPAYTSAATISLPVPVELTFPGSAEPIGSGYVLDTSASRRYALQSVLVSASTYWVFRSAALAGGDFANYDAALSSATPMTPNTGDVIYAPFQCRVA